MREREREIHAKVRERENETIDSPSLNRAASSEFPLFAIENIKCNPKTDRKCKRVKKK